MFPKVMTQKIAVEVCQDTSDVDDVDSLQTASAVTLRTPINILGSSMEE